MNKSTNNGEGLNPFDIFHLVFGSGFEKELAPIPEKQETPASKQPAPGQLKLKFVLVQNFRPLDSVLPAPENDAIYNAISWDDPDIRELARSIKAHGVQEPLIVCPTDTLSPVTERQVVLHRRPHP